MRNLIKAERFKFLHSSTLWIVIAVLFAFCSISILTGVYDSAESALRSISKDIPIPLLGCSVYSAIILLDDFSNGMIKHYIASGYKRAFIMLAKFFHYIFGCCILLFVYPLLCVTFTAIVRGVETSFVLVMQQFIFVYIKSLPLYLGIVSIFFLACILLKNAATAMAVSVAVSISLVVFSNKLYANNFAILKYSPMIQLDEIAANPISFEYYVAAAAAVFLLGSCLCIGIAKFKNDEF